MSERRRLPTKVWAAKTSFIRDLILVEAQRTPSAQRLAGLIRVLELKSNITLANCVSSTVFVLAPLIACLSLLSLSLIHISEPTRPY